MALAVILVIAWAIAKTITNYRIDREYAKQGLDSPRMRLKLDKAVRGEISPEAVHRTRPGASGYFRELWDDAWEDATGRHRARRQAKKDGTAPPKQHAKPWWRYLFDPIGDTPTDRSPEPSPTRQPHSQASAEPAPPPAAPKKAPTPPAAPTPSPAPSPAPRNEAAPGKAKPPTQTSTPPGTANPSPLEPDGVVAGIPGAACNWCGQPTTGRYVPVPSDPLGGLPACDTCVDQLQHQAATRSNPKPCARCGAEATTTHAASMLPICRTCGDKHQATPGGIEPFVSAANQHVKEDAMTDTHATGDVHDVESCDRELDALTDDLTAIDTALDVIDEKVREARNSSELVSAFLAGKNVDGTVLDGLATALDALGPDAIKALIDRIAAAKAGVQATKEAMGPLREASELVGAADGSVLNGR